MSTLLPSTIDGMECFKDGFRGKTDASLWRPQRTGLWDSGLEMGILSGYGGCTGHMEFSFCSIYASGSQ